MPKKQKIQTLLSAKSTADLHAEVIADLEAQIPDPQIALAKFLAAEKELKKKDEEQREEDNKLIAKKMIYLEELEGN